ncbi:MAG TPA: hypothetical protein VGL63_10025 [Streptosporangiaceae bacterium]
MTAEEHSANAGDGNSADAGDDNGQRTQPGAPAARASRWIYSAVTRHLAVLAGYLGAGILFTWPRITYLGNHKLPDTRDAGAYVWGFWWIARQVEHLSNPWFTHYLAAPVGVQLGFHALMPLPGVIMMPITAAFGPTVSYNLLSALMPGLLCYAMYRAARLWVRSEIAAIAGGAFFGLSSMLAYQSFYLLNVAAGALFIPLALEAAVRLRRRPAWGQGAILGIVVGASLLTDQEGFVLVLIVVVLALLPWLIFGSGQSLLDRVRPVAVSALVTLLVASPQLIAMVQQVNAGGTSIDPHLLAVSYTSYGVGALGLFAPSPRLASFGLTKLGSQYYAHGIIYRQGLHHHLIPTSEATPMFGLVLSVLALCGLILAWRRRNSWLLALLWLGSALLALGPVLWIGTTHEYVPFAEMLHGVRVSALMPYTWFVRLPGLSSFREASRLAEPGMAAAALLAATSIDWLRYHARAAMVVVLALGVLELGWTGNPPNHVMPPVMRIGTMPTDMPDLNRPIIADHSASVVVDFPFGIRGGIPLYGQAFAPISEVLAAADGHPLADGFISRVPAPTVNGIQGHPFYANLLNVWSSPGVTIPPATLAAAAADAKRMSVGWVIVWPTHVTNAIARYLNSTGFKLAYRVHHIKVYRMGS